MTAAHATLPLPTWVEVTNLNNGKRVIVKVNDRGPFVGKRLIDLSHAAASALDMVRAGTAPVEVRALSAPPEAGSPRNRDQNSTSTMADEPVGRPSPVTTKWRPESLQRTLESPRPTPGSSRPAPESPPPIPSSPPRTPDSRRPAVDRPPATESKRLFAQAGKFSTRDNAVELVDTLKAHGFVNAFVVTEDRRRRSLHRVQIGPLLDAKEFDRVSEQLCELGAKRSQLVAMR
jgi:rare lipoprotein A